MDTSAHHALAPAPCAICRTYGDALELYTARLAEEALDAHAFSARRFYDRKIHFRMARCVRCGLVRSDPVMPSGELAQLYRASHFTYEGEVANLALTYGRYLARVRPHHVDTGRFLDIGCGNGFMMEEAARHGYREIYGVEPSEEATANAAPLHRANIAVAMFSAGLFPPASFDVITLFQTLDHLSNPRAVLADCFTLLRPGGIVLMLNHNVRAMSARILGERSPIIDIEHTYLYDTRTIRAMCEVEGFVVREVGAAWNTVSLEYLVSLLPISNARIKDGALRMLELLHLARVPVRAPLGNLYCIAQKPTRHSDARRAEESNTDENNKRMKIFITGISSGIGRALAKQCIEAGDEVWGVARRAELLDELTREIGSDRLRVSVCDVQDEAQNAAVALELRAAGFIPDAIVLNAGVYHSDIGETFAFDLHRESFAINVHGALFFVAEFLPDFLARGSGTFLAISSTAALRPSGSASYSASKAALSMAFRQFRLDYCESGVAFSTVHFGPIDTHMWRGRRLPGVPSADDAARYLMRLLTRRSGAYYYPWFTTTLLRCSLFLPDTFFRAVARFMLKS